jgi:hypothetical protein
MLEDGVFDPDEDLIDRRILYEVTGYKKEGDDIISGSSSEEELDPSTYLTQTLNRRPAVRRVKLINTRPAEGA